MSNPERKRASASAKSTVRGKNLTLSQTISKSIAAEILEGVIAPGTKLDEPSLAERFDVSRSPVRDALRHLAGMRLVQHQPRRGFTVNGIDEQGLKDLYEGLTEIEAVCAGLCAMRATPMERMKIQMLFQQCKEAAAAADHQKYVLLNDQFHAAIYAGTHNATLEAVANELRQRLMPLRIRPFFEQQRLDESIKEHKALVEAIMEQDRGLAAAAMLEHAAHTGMSVLDRMKSSLSI